MCQQRDSRDARPAGAVCCCRTELIQTATQLDKTNHCAVQVITATYYVGDVLLYGNYNIKLSGEFSGGDIRIPVQDYKCVHIAVMIWATVVNTQTHRRTLNGHTQ